jgi:hypothetical protein
MYFYLYPAEIKKSTLLYALSSQSISQRSDSNIPLCRHVRSSVYYRLSLRSSHLQALSFHFSLGLMLLSRRRPQFPTLDTCAESSISPRWTFSEFPSLMLPKPFFQNKHISSPPERQTPK